MKNIDSQLEIIKQGAAEIIQEAELIEKLKSNKPLTVKVGLDPTMPDMHLGHTVVINKLRQFQKLGHNAVFLIGDYTACIGDPSGRDATRPAVDPKTIKDNSKKFQKEIFKILDKEKTKVREFIRYEKFYDSGKYRSKSLARFIKPNIVKGTGLLSWIQKNGKTDQWFFLPKLKTAKKVKAKERSRSFLNTDFIYEDLESRKPGLDSLATIGTELLDGNQCRVLMAWPKNESAYFSRKIWVSLRTWQIQKVEYYKNESEKEKTLTLTDFIESNGFRTAGKMTMDRGDGNKTIMQITSFKPEMGLNEEIFSKSFLIKI